MKITTAYFSATRTTKKVVTAIANDMGGEVHHHPLISHPLQEEICIPADELLLVGMPVYAGRIPTPALASLRLLKGHHTPVVLVAVYGNREFDDIFVELQDLLEANGFFVLAAGAFIAQHSIFGATAKGRPDDHDRTLIHDFALRCKARFEAGYDETTRSVALPGNRPYKVPGNIPLKVVTSSACTSCGACIKACPVQAIPLDNPQVTDYDKCIHCGHCIDICSTHARHYTGLLYKVAGAVFTWKNRKRKEPQWFF